jgi:hypothetical protein
MTQQPQSQPVITWQMLFAAVGLAGSILSVWINTREELVSMRKDMAHMSAQLSQAQNAISAARAAEIDAIRKIEREIEMIRGDMTQIRFRQSQMSQKQ